MLINALLFVKPYTGSRFCCGSTVTTCCGSTVTTCCSPNSWEPLLRLFTPMKQLRMLKRDFIELLFIRMPVAMARKQKPSQPLTGADLLIYRECNLLSVRAAFRIFITFRISLLQPAVYCSVPILHRTTSASFRYPLLTPSLTAKQIITRRLSASHKPPVCQTTTLTAFPPPGG